jgi:Tol biopolymer transport system component
LYFACYGLAPCQESKPAAAVALTTGTRVGPYEITALIGAGGMGEVYRARDTRLNRDVAIKVLPDAFTRDVERLSRFKREAQVLASLNHPHIAAIYGLEESDGVRALVMELVEGDILRCPQPRPVALSYARQIAEALEYAHERGVIHRDLKPANIKVTADGVVKVLDFGLAKAVDNQSWLLPDATHSPTLSLGATTAGVIVGTAAYMAPEQASGKPADRRADVWSFGAVLYEMLTGRQAFEGESVSDTLASVLKVEPDWTRLPADTPPALRRLVSRCLTKDRKQRMQSIGDARIEIDDSIAGVQAVETVAPRTRATRSLVVAGVVGLAALALGAGWYMRGLQAAPGQSMHFSIVPPAGLTVNFAGIVTPDGSRIVFGAFDKKDGSNQLYVRELDDPSFKPIAGSEGAYFPILSPDGRWVAFFDGARLKKVPIGGGSPTVIVSSGGSCGTWSDDDIIYFCPSFGSGLSAVSASGGEPRVITKTDLDRGELWHGYPHALPGGKAVLFTIYTVEKSFEEGRLAVVSLATGEKRVLLDGVRNAEYIPGHLLFGRGHEVLAVPFDLDTLRVTGQPTRVQEGVMVGFGRPSIVNFSASAAGPLVYGAGNNREDSVLTVFDDTGAQRARIPLKGFAYSAALSPDGSRVALQAPPDDIWVLQLDSQAMTKLTFEPGEHETPVWSPDGKRVAYTSSRRGIARAIFVRAADGNGPEERLFTSDRHIHISSWSADAQSIVFEQGEVATGNDIWVYRFGDAKPQPLLRSAADERDGDFAPNGHYLTYTSNESGRTEVYVQPFPTTGAKWQISTAGGFSPRWSHDGRVLRYFDLNGQPLVVPVDTGSAFTKGIARPLRSGGLGIEPLGFCLFSRDGAACTKTEEAMERVDVMLNWFGKLGR